MPAAQIDLKRVEDPRDAVLRAVEALASGKLVAFPSETVYGLAASALCESAVQRLVETKRRGSKAFALAIKSADDALDYVPEISPLGLRLARRCWPGPLTLVLDDAHPDSVVNRLSSAVQQVVVPEGKIGLRVPAHPVALQILRLSAGPLVLTSANFAGQPEAKTGSEVMQQLGDSIDLILDDGPCRYGQSSTVVEVRGNKLTILREGVINLQTLSRMSVFLALLVCTGNTCRSPMAEGLMRRRLADLLGCSPDQLSQRGIVVQSAGIAAMPGAAASEQAVQVMRQLGIDLSNHCSQPVTEHLVRSADLILTMTASHRNAIVNQWPEVLPRTFTLSGDHGDIADPVGHPLDVYQYCAQQIEHRIDHWAKAIAQSIQSNSE